MTQIRRNPGTSARATSTTPTVADTSLVDRTQTMRDPACVTHSFDALVKRGKALVESGKHAPPPQQWTVDELQQWFGPSRPSDVVSLADYRRRRGAVAK
jgi:hypothetical protein